MAYTLQIGAIRCHVLSDGLHYVDGGGFFGLIPRAMWEQVIEPTPANLVPCDSRSLLIESDAGLILVDVGNGDKLPAKARERMGLGARDLRLVGEIARAGYKPEDIDIVFFTHFHGDHIGGATRWAEGANGHVAEPTFPRARYIGNRIELADATFPNERTAATYIADNFRPLLDRGILEIVDGPRPVTRTRSRSCGSKARARACSFWATRRVGRCICSGWRGFPPSTSCRCRASRPSAACATKRWRRTRCSSFSMIHKLSPGGW